MASLASSAPFQFLCAECKRVAIRDGGSAIDETYVAGVILQRPDHKIIRGASSSSNFTLRPHLASSKLRVTHYINDLEASFC